MREIGYFSIIVPTFGEKGVALTRRCVESLRLTHEHLGKEAIEVILVEDSQKPEVLEELDKIANQHSCQLLSQPNGGFAKACNLGLRNANGMLNFLVNNDIEFFEPCLQILSDAAQITMAGAIGCRLLYPDSRIQHAGVVFVPTPDGPLPGYFDHVLRFQGAMHPYATVLRPSLVTGALFGITRWAIDMVGLLDERFEFSAEDIDYCLQVMEAGRDTFFCGYTAAVHKEGATRGATPEEKAKFAPDVAEKEMKSLSFLFQKWVGADFSIFAT